MVTQVESQMSTAKDLAAQIFDVAFALIEGAEGDIELARRSWSEAFEEAERIDHNQSMGEPDETERAIAEQAERFERAEEARAKFRVV
jgi:hypothetical protein